MIKGLFCSRLKWFLDLSIRWEILHNLSSSTNSWERLHKFSVVDNLEKIQLFQLRKPFGKIPTVARTRRTVLIWVKTPQVKVYIVLVADAHRPLEVFVRVLKFWKVEHENKTLKSGCRLTWKRNKKVLKYLEEPLCRGTQLGPIPTIRNDRQRCNVVCLFLIEGQQHLKHNLHFLVISHNFAFSKGQITFISF